SSAPRSRSATSEPGSPGPPRRRGPASSGTRQASASRPRPSSPAMAANGSTSRCPASTRPPSAPTDGFKPSMLADLSPDIALLRGVDIALAGRLHIEADGHGDVRSIEVDVVGGNGMVALPGVLPASHRVKSVNAHATMDAATHPAKIDRVDIDFGAT